MRNLEAEFQELLSSKNLRMGFLMEGEFTTGWLRIWTGVGSLEWNSYTWQGAGNLIELSTLSEGTGVRADGIEAVLSLGFPNLSQAVAENIASLALEEVKQGGDCKVYWVLFTRVGNRWQIVAEPAVWFKGRIDIPTIDGIPGKPVFRLTAENRMATFKRARGGVYSHEEQQRRFPGDLGLEFIHELTQQQTAVGRGGPVNNGGGTDVRVRDGALDIQPSVS